jgi:hypothetical protein
VSYRVCTDENETEECFQSNVLTSTQNPEESWFPVRSSKEATERFKASNRVWIPVCNHLSMCMRRNKHMQEI